MFTTVDAHRSFEHIIRPVTPLTASSYLQKSSLKFEATDHRFFEILWLEDGSQYDVFLHHTEFRCLSRFISAHGTRTQIIMLRQEQKNGAIVTIQIFVPDLAYLTDILLLLMIHINNTGRIYKSGRWEEV